MFAATKALLTSTTAQAAVEFDAVGAGAHAHATTITWAHTIASDATCLVVGIGEFVGSNPSLAQWVRSVKVGATQGGAVNLDSLGVDYLNHNQGSNGLLELWGLINPPTGAMNIYVSYVYSSFTPYLNGGSVSYKGVTAFGTGFSAADMDWGSTSAIKSHAMTSGNNHRVVACQGIYNKTISAPSVTQRYLYPATATSNYTTMHIQDTNGAQTVTPLTATGGTGASWLSIAVDLVPQSTPAAENWVEEFTGSANSAPNTANWVYDTGGGGWGNNELQTYTNSTNNVYLDGSGNLVIKAIRSGSPGSYTYTSGRIKTLGKQNMGYGTISASIKMPWGQGTWPAFWMLGTDDDVNLWPRCGEIDIIEYVNLRDDPDGFYWNLALHGPMSNPANDYSPPVNASESIAWDPSGDFHTYAVTRAADSIAFAIDGTTEWTATPASLPAGASWVFNDQPMYVLLNLAIGGDWPGDPGGTTTWPQTMTVAWVKYEPA